MSQFWFDTERRELCLFLCSLHRSFWLWQQWVCSTARAVVWRALIGAVFNGTLPVILHLQATRQ